MKQPIKYILEEDFCVSSAETDFNYELKVSSLVNMFIQIAWRHAEELGFGIDYLHKNNLAWVLSKLHFKIETFPKWSDSIKLVTWPKGINRLFYLRDMEIYDKNGYCISYSTSEWLLIDTKSKRPKLQSSHEELFVKNKDKHAIGYQIENLKPLIGNASNFSFKAQYSDIDLNQHLTTTRYIDWMFDTFEMEFFKKNLCSEMVINFIREVPFGTEVSVYRVSFPEINCHEFEFVENASKHVLFRGKLYFREKLNK
jgi:medium-chain acyl-[acyl-carrier-protein] hydrolase